MVLKIVPSIIAKNQKEFDERFEKIKNVSKEFHLDVMDGKFVKNKSLMFDLELPRKKYQVHLMVKNPREIIKVIYGKADTIIFHFESFKDKKEIEETIKFVKSKKKKVGLAINPKTKVDDIKYFLKKINLVLVMTVNPGKYGAKFLPKALDKIKEIKKINKKVKVQVDGGINDKTISLAKSSKADSFVVGSYLQKSKNIKEALSNLDKRRLTK